MRQELILMVGIPGCGKSTFIERFLPYHTRVNLDSIHAELDPEKGFDQNNIKRAREIEEERIRAALAKGESAVADCTNMTAKARKKYFRMAQESGSQVSAVYFTPDLDTALRQNQMRERKVPEVAIRAMLKQYEMPASEEGFSRVLNAAEPNGLYGSKPAVFLDRDGVILPTQINGKPFFITKPDELAYIDNAISGLQRITQKTSEIYLISNQGGNIRRKKFTAQGLELITEKMVADLAGQGINFAGIYYCLHDDKAEECACRKPKTGLIIKAAMEHGLDITRSYMIGDMTTDTELGRRVHAKTIILETGYGGKDGKVDVSPDFTARDLLEAASLVNF